MSLRVATGLVWGHSAAAVPNLVLGVRKALSDEVERLVLRDRVRLHCHPFRVEGHVRRLVAEAVLVYSKATKADAAAPASDGKCAAAAATVPAAELPSALTSSSPKDESRPAPYARSSLPCLHTPNSTVNQ